MRNSIRNVMQLIKKLDLEMLDERGNCWNTQ